jgi:hypothetical protein
MYKYMYALMMLYSNVYCVKLKLKECLIFHKKIFAEFHFNIIKKVKKSLNGITCRLKQLPPRASNVNMNKTLITTIIKK